MKRRRRRAKDDHQHYEPSVILIIILILWCCAGDDEAEGWWWRWLCYLGKKMGKMMVVLLGQEVASSDGNSQHSPRWSLRLTLCREIVVMVTTMVMRLTINSSIRQQHHHHHMLRNEWRPDDKVTPVIDDGVHGHSHRVLCQNLITS